MIDNLKKIFFFSTDFVVLLIGTILSQIVNFGFSLLISRIYTSVEYGNFNQILSWISIIGTILLLRLEQAIMVQKNEDKNYYLFLISLILANSFFVALFFVFLTNYTTIIILLSLLSIIFTSLNLEMYLIALKQQNIWICSISKFVKTFSFNSLTVILGYFYSPESEYITISYTISLLIEFIILLLVNRWIKDISKVLKIKYIQYKNYFIENINFIKWNLPHVIIDLLNDWGFILLLGKTFGDYLVGQYAMMFRVIKLPASLIGSVIYQYSYSKASSQNSNLNKIIKHNYVLSFSLGILFYAIMFLFGKNIFSFTFGENWKDAGLISEILSPAYFIHFIIVSSSFVVILKDKMSIAFLITICEFAFRIISVVIAYYYGDWNLCFYSLSFFLTIIYFCGLFYYWNISKK